MRSLSTILKKVLRLKNTKPPISNGPPTTTIQKKPQTTFVPTKISMHTENLKFSESKAYFGIDKRKPLDEVIVVASQSYLEVCNPAAHKRKVTASFLNSFAVNDLPDHIYRAEEGAFTLDI
uniref:Uncharacterized protein n=1 Tax=Wuchereria bancrofti TaxID=6293 RepID=A0AAF5Q764_WUCBA